MDANVVKQLEVTIRFYPLQWLAGWLAGMWLKFTVFHGKLESWVIIDQIRAIHKLSHLKSNYAICRCPFCRFTQVNSFRYLHTYIYVTTQHRYMMFIVHTKPKFVIQTWIQGFAERQECFIISILDNLSKTDCTEYRLYSKTIDFSKFDSFHVVLDRIQVYRHSSISAVLISTFFDFNFF